MLDLISRVASLNDAIFSLRLPYTYELIERISPEKKQARQTLGFAAVEMIELIRDKVLDAAIRDYLLYKGLNSRQVEVIFRSFSDGTSEIGTPTDFLGSSERSSKTTKKNEEIINSGIIGGESFERGNYFVAGNAEVDQSFDKDRDM